ncbi:RHS repeat domain-containing protein [Paenibacillus sp. PL2-23]|uniref:RHS repeat domain-containing protein n=2 Tax=Paenibacillus sp. PL2-23 TaxID=2100729 RepID=UPI00349EB5C2
MGLAKKCGYTDEEYPDMHPGGPRDGWEKQHKKQHWELNFTNDVSLALPEPLQVTEADPTKWKETYVYGAGGERLSMTYLPAYDANNGWEPAPGAGGAEPGVQPKTLWYMHDALGSVIGLAEKDGRVSARYHYDEFGVMLDSKKTDLNWSGPDNLFGYTGLGYDYSSGLTYARARYYQPEIGRFISEDTYKGDLWNPQSQNQFTYVHNNPLIYTDPSGNYCVSADGAWAHEGICNNPETSYWFPDNGQPIVENGILKGKVGSSAAAVSYQRYEIKFNAWNATEKPDIRNPGPNVTPSIITFDPYQDTNSFDAKFEFDGDFIGTKMEYKAYAGGVKLMNSRLVWQK